MSDGTSGPISLKNAIVIPLSASFCIDYLTRYRPR